ncbi:uncharacterized protein LOC135834281 [Planococcus citri]|uniref:uncharacterized protein LOC135834281 n=1 Tax=Planococcus citri TaxID=170843 RepID=UPI0031F82C2B
MTEPTSKVFDLTYTSPVTLKEIAAIALVVELWRGEIARTEIKTPNELDLAEDIPLKEIIPAVPSVIYDLLDKYLAKFRLSIAQWIAYHSIHVFNFHYKSYTEALINFHDFVWDWNGAIHYVRTAKRMMLCDRLTEDEKFKIACLYCFEDDIKRIWPSVSSEIDSIQINFDRDPLLYYWICYLRNELHNVPNASDQPIDEVMLVECGYHNYPSAEYFWNRIPYERQSQAAIDLSMNGSDLFARFILPKLDDFQLEKFLAERGVDFMASLLIHNWEKIHALPTWMYIRNKMNKSHFIRLVEKLLEEETNQFVAKERLNPEDEVYLWCEVWKNAPQNLKRFALNDVLSNEELFNRTSKMPSEPREMRFLITVLLDASYEQRHKFWYDNWRNLISGARVDDLLGVMRLCFQNENDVSLFKQQYMSKYENIGPYCVELLEGGCFKELSEFLSFCYSDQNKVKELKQQLLRSNFLGEDSILRFGIFCFHTKPLNEFVEDAFEDVGLRTEFKNQFVSSPVTEDYLFDCIRLGYFGCVIQFVEIFVPDERAVNVLKQRLLANFRERLVSGVIWQMKGDNLQKFLVWLLGSEDAIGDFKQSLSVNEIFCNVVQFELHRGDEYDYEDDEDVPMEYPDRLDDFLKWYFSNDAEEVRKIKERYSDKLKVFSQRE